MILSVSRVAKAFGPDVVLRDCTFRIDAREKVALVGRNGAGKSTLLRIITGQYAPDTGNVLLQRGAKVGYLRQEKPVDEGRTVLEEAQTALARQLELKTRLTELEAKMEAGSADDEDLEEYALVHEHFLEAEGYSAETDLKVVLQRMGFTEEDFSKPTAKLSGGERTRLAIARLLLEEPDLLILDEPTNHLDLQATEWLESWVRAYHGAVLLVSHDRTFLDATAERVLEMKDGSVRSWPGPFEKYLKLKEEEDARLADVARKQADEIAKLDEYVRRFINTQRTAQARGRRKIMERLIESKIDAPKNDKGIKAGFGDAKRSGDIVVETQKATIGFADESLFQDFDWTVRYGERWGIIGENGSGKSTLMKVAMGVMEPLSGRARLGAGVVAGYFTQDGDDLDPDESPLDTLVYDLDMKPPEARNLLGRFLISGDDVYRPIKTMSGGEKNKLSLAKLTQINPNLLVLDEPTNHLDMASRDALVDVLRDYKGTLILISHDRWLLSQTVDHILDVRRAGPIIYPGGYNDYRSGKKAISETSKSNVPTAAPKEPTMTPRELSKEIERMEKLVAQIEDEVHRHEEEIKAVEALLSDLPAGADVLQLTQDHQMWQERLEGQMSAWEENTHRLEELRTMRG